MILLHGSIDKGYIYIYHTIHRIILKTVEDILTSILMTISIVVTNFLSVVKFYLTINF